MCQYSYSQFAQCNHRLIEVTNFCPKALWRAAMSGQLGPCPELAFRSHLAKAFHPSAASVNAISPEVEKSYVWQGMSGYCRACVCRYKMPKPTHPQRTYQDAPLSQFSSQEVVSHINSYNGPSLPTSRVKPPPEHPYVYLPFINRSLYELLSIADQYNEKLQGTCKIQFFPSMIFLYTSFEKWKSPAHVDGVLLTGVPNWYFALNCGLTPLDRRCIGEEVKKGKGLREVWEMKFAERGTHLDLFLKVAAVGEVYPPKKEVAPAEG